MYYIIIENNKIYSSGEYPVEAEGFINVEVTKEFHDDYVANPDKYMWNGKDVVANPDYEEIIKRKERERLDALTLTPSDVERALLAAKGWDFDDLKAFLKNEQGYTDLQIKAIGVELRANDFYRGAVLKGTNIRIVDTIGALLGYDSDDMDYLFEHKELPIKDNQTDAQQQPLNENDFLEDEIPF